MFIAGTTGDHNVAAVHPHPHITSRYEVGIAMMAVLAPQFLRDPDPLAHGYPARELHITVTQIREIRKCKPRLLKQDVYTLPRDLLGRWVFGSLLHCLVTGSRLCYSISVSDKIVAVIIGTLKSI
jgi:hypothetical protein